MHEWCAENDVAEACLKDVLHKFRHIVFEHQSGHSQYTAFSELFVIAPAEAVNAIGECIDECGGWETR